MWPIQHFKTYLSNCSTKMWLAYIVIDIICVALLWAGVYTFINVGLYTLFDDGWSTPGLRLMLVSISIMLLSTISRIGSRIAQRQIFLQQQAKHGYFPNSEGFCTTLLLNWFCSPCTFGQMNSAIEKLNQPQKFVHVV